MSAGATLKSEFEALRAGSLRSTLELSRDAVLRLLDRHEVRGPCLLNWLY